MYNILSKNWNKMFNIIFHNKYTVHKHDLNVIFQNEN